MVDTICKSLRTSNIVVFFCFCSDGSSIRSVHERAHYLYYQLDPTIVHEISAESYLVSIPVLLDSLSVVIFIVRYKAKCTHDINMAPYERRPMHSAYGQNSPIMPRSGSRCYSKAPLILMHPSRQKVHRNS